MRHLWLLFFGGLVGGLYYFSRLPAAPGRLATAAPFRWALLWAPEDALPPSERLASFLGQNLDLLLTPLEDEALGEMPLEEVRQLAAGFGREADRTRPERRPACEAAVQVCRGLHGAMSGRLAAEARFRTARTSRATYYDPVARQRASSRALFEGQARAEWARESAQWRARLEPWVEELRTRERRAGW